MFGQENIISMKVAVQKLFKTLPMTLSVILRCIVKNNIQIRNKLCLFVL